MGDRYEIDSKSVNLRNIEFNSNHFKVGFTPVLQCLLRFQPNNAILGPFRTKISKSNALSVIWPDWPCTNYTTGVISFKTLRRWIKYFIQTTK